MGGFLSSPWKGMRKLGTVLGPCNGLSCRDREEASSFRLTTIQAAGHFIALIPGQAPCRQLRHTISPRSHSNCKIQVLFASFYRW